MFKKSSFFGTEVRGKKPSGMRFRKALGLQVIGMMKGHMDVSENSGTQQPWVFLLKMIILGCFGGTPILGNTYMHKSE